MRCQTCSLESPDGKDFCPHCGAAVMGGKHPPRLGQYRLDAKLGEGGMGVVYQATDEKLHREVAVKVLHSHLLQNEDLKERFRREARMHAKLMHPNVVTLLSLYEDGEHMALVMEMVHGKNLKEYLKVHSSISLVDLVKICDAILAGLDAAHHFGMVHRDLKPANVLLSANGDVKLMDFGLAKPQQKGDDDLTQSGATVGSFRYMAPEQILNQAVDARTDLYAFGILLYQICTGKLPFDATASGGGEFEIMEKQVREKPVPPRKLVPSLPLSLSNLILRLLEKRPADRPLDCKEVRNELHALLKKESKAAKDGPIHMPSRQVSEDSSADIAKGLLKALAQNVFGVFYRASRSLKPGIATIQKKIKKMAASMSVKAKMPTVQKKVKKTVASQPASKRWQPPLTWLVLVLFVTAIGWILISVINMAERPSSSASTIDLNPPVKTAEVEVDKPVTKPVSKPIVKKSESTVKAPAKPVVKKPKSSPPAKKASKPKKVSRSVTNYVDHKVVRGDRSRVDTKKPHEFRGGSRLWFSSLKNYQWKASFRTFKKGESIVYLTKPIPLSKIILKKASVGRLSFKGGYVRLSVRNSRGKWTKLFEREGDDVDIPVTISGPKKALKDVKAVRIRFKTPEPIKIGPIDLIR